jgi:hypothetical protein
VENANIRETKPETIRNPSPKRNGDKVECLFLSLMHAHFRAQDIARFMPKVEREHENSVRDTKRRGRISMHYNAGSEEKASGLP